MSGKTAEHTPLFSEIFSMMQNGVFWDVTPEEPHGIASQKTPFFIVTAMKTSNLTFFNDVVDTMHLVYCRVIFSEIKLVPWR
jgi:hypothetical protein